MKDEIGSKELHDTELAEMPKHERDFIKKARELKRLLQERLDCLEDIDKAGSMTASQEIWLIRLQGTVQTLEDIEMMNWEIN